LTFRDTTAEELATIEQMVGRPLNGRCAVVVRRRDGRPVVIENEPHLRDGTPMPTLYWLIDSELNEAVSRIEGASGVHRYEELVDAEELVRTHDDYRRRREAATVHRDAIAPRGGVGGTRVGVKCLHAHLANYLAGNDDPVGQLVAGEVAVPDLVIVDVRD
jgi:hypothetical protein